MAEIWLLKFSYNGFYKKIQTSFGKALKISIQFFFTFYSILSPETSDIWVKTSAIT